MDKLKEFINENQSKVLTTVYKELLHGNASTQREMADELRSADYNSLFGFDCGLVYLKSNGQKLMVSKLVSDTGNLARACSVQSTTIQNAILEEILALAKTEGLSGLEDAKVHIWID